MTKPHHIERHGDYVVALHHSRSFWNVRHHAGLENISQHNTKREALAAVKRYQAGDKRRQVQS